MQSPRQQSLVCVPTLAGMFSSLKHCREQLQQQRSLARHRLWLNTRLSIMHGVQHVPPFHPHQRSSESHRNKRNTVYMKGEKPDFKHRF